MSVKSDAVGDALSNASAFDAKAAYTMCAWVRFDTVSGRCWQVAAGTDWQNRDIVYNDGVNDLIFNANVGGVGAAVTMADVLTTGTWFRIGVIRTSASSAKLYCNGTASAAQTQNVAARSNTSNLTINGERSGASYITPLLGSTAHMKIWTAALTEAELEQEFWSIMPKRTDNLWAWYPMIPGMRAVDLSGNGRTLTEQGTLADDTDPGVSFSRGIIYPMQSGAPATGVAEFGGLNLYRRGGRRWIAV